MNNIKLQQDLCNVIRQTIDQKDIMGANLLITKDDKEKRYHMMIHDLLDMSSGLSYPDDATEAWRAVGKIYEDLMRRCIAPEEHRNLCTYGEYGWDGWLVRHVFCQFTKRKYNFIDWYAEKGCRYIYPYKKIAQCML